MSGVWLPCPGKRMAVGIRSPSPRHPLPVSDVKAASPRPGGGPATGGGWSAQRAGKEADPGAHRSVARGYCVVGMPRRYAANSLAPPEAAWSLIAEPARRPAAAPHRPGAWGLGSPEVVPGKVGVARLFGVGPVPARIVHRGPGRSWTWRVGRMVLVHAVTPRGNGGCRVAMTLQAPGPLEPLLA